jgi:hypothetical protein
VPTAAGAAAPDTAERPESNDAAARKPAPASKSKKAAAGNNSILKYFTKQPVPAQ